MRNLLAFMLVAGFIFSSCVEGTKPKQNIYDDTNIPDRETGDTEPPVEDLPEPIVDANGVIGKDNTFEFGTWNVRIFPRQELQLKLSPTISIFGISMLLQFKKSNQNHLLKI